VNPVRKHLRKRLTEAPILVYPSFDREFILETDASIRGLGGVLSQYQDDKKRHPVAFASRALNPAERNYSITDLETLAVVWGISHFRTYLYGQRVTVYTDHAAVKAVLQSPNTSGRHARWWTRVYGAGLREVNIVYRAGKENPIADALSRKVPEALLSDRGTNLLSHLMRDVCRLLGIEKYNTTAYHPQCNGLNERFNLIQSHIKNDAQKACR
jgi:transposase InsO family protein